MQKDGQACLNTNNWKWPLANNVWLSFLFIVPFQMVLKKRESSPGFWGSARWQWRHLGTPASPPGTRRSSQSCDLQIDNVDIFRKWEWTTEKTLDILRKWKWTTDKALNILRKWKWNNWQSSEYLEKVKVEYWPSFHQVNCGGGSPLTLILHTVIRFTWRGHTIHPV